MCLLVPALFYLCRPGQQWGTRDVVCRMCSGPNERSRDRRFFPDECERVVVRRQDYDIGTGTVEILTSTEEDLDRSSRMLPIL